MSTPREITSTLVLLLFGVGYLVYSTEYPMDTWNNPGPSVFPTFVGGAFVLLALVHLLQSLRIRERGEREENAQLKNKPLRVSRPFILVAYFIVYVLLIPWAGFFVSTVTFVIVSSRLMEAEGWLRPFALGMGVDLFCYWVFEGWLKLSLPKGFLF